MTAELENQLGGLCLSEPAICLPTELYREVFSYVSSMRDLCNLSVLCHDLQPEAEFFIYRTVQSDNRTHTEYLCDIITSSPHRHMLVRSLSISHDEWGAAPISAARDREFWDRVARLLHDLPYLEELKIHDMAMKHGNTNSWVLSRATFTLHQFDCDFVFDDHLAAFLYSQRQLKRLYWAESCVDENSRRALEDMDAHAASLGPCLSLLNTNSARFAVKCMKQAPLSHIWVSGPCAYEDDGWMRYMEEFVADGGTSSLLSLRLNFPYRKRTLIALLWALAKTTPNLRSLGFLPLFTHQDSDIIDALSQFKKLQSIVTWNVIERNTSRLIAEACPSLRLIACLHYSYSHEYVVLPVNPFGTPRPLHDPLYLLWKDV